MVTLVVATTSDPASINPAKELLAMPGWQPGPTLEAGIKSFKNGDVRIFEQDKSIIEEDDLDLRWEAATKETVDEIIFLSKHTAVSNRPALTIHPIGENYLCVYVWLIGVFCLGILQISISCLLFHAIVIIIYPSFNFTLYLSKKCRDNYITAQHSEL